MGQLRISRKRKLGRNEDLDHYLTAIGGGAVVLEQVLKLSFKPPDSLAVNIKA